MDFATYIFLNWPQIFSEPFQTSTTANYHFGNVGNIYWWNKSIQGLNKWWQHYCVRGYHFTEFLIAGLPLTTQTNWFSELYAFSHYMFPACYTVDWSFTMFFYWNHTIVDGFSTFHPKFVQDILRKKFYCQEEPKLNIATSCLCMCTAGKSTPFPQGLLDWLLLPTSLGIHHSTETQWQSMTWLEQRLSSPSRTQTCLSSMITVAGE